MGNEISRTPGQGFKETFQDDQGGINVRNSNETIRQKQVRDGQGRGPLLYQHSNRIYNPVVRFFRDLANAVFDPKHFMDHMKRKSNGGAAVVETLRRSYGDVAADAILKKVGIDVSKSGDKWKPREFSRMSNRNLHRDITGRDVHRIFAELDKYTEENGTYNLEFYKKNKAVKDSIAAADPNDPAALDKIRSQISNLFETFVGPQGDKADWSLSSLADDAAIAFDDGENLENMNLQQLKTRHEEVFGKMSEKITQTFETKIHSWGANAVQQVKTHVDPGQRPVTATDMAQLVKNAYNYGIYENRGDDYYENECPAFLYQDPEERKAAIDEIKDSDAAQKFLQLNSLAMYDARNKLHNGTYSGSGIDLDERTIAIKLPPWTREGITRNEWFDNQLEEHNISKDELKAALPRGWAVYPYENRQLDYSEQQQVAGPPPNSDEPWFEPASNIEWDNFEKALDLELQKRGIVPKDADDISYDDDEIADILGVVDPDLVDEQPIGQLDAVEEEEQDVPQNLVGQPAGNVAQPAAGGQIPARRLEGLSNALNDVADGKPVGPNDETIKLSEPQAKRLNSITEIVDRALQAVQGGGAEVNSQNEDIVAAWTEISNLMHPLPNDPGAGLALALAPVSLDLAKAYVTLDRIMNE